MNTRVEKEWNRSMALGLDIGMNNSRYLEVKEEGPFFGFIYSDL